MPRGLKEDLRNYDVTDSQLGKALRLAHGLGQMLTLN